MSEMVQYQQPFSPVRPTIRTAVEQAVISRIGRDPIDEKDRQSDHAAKILLLSTMCSESSQKNTEEFFAVRDKVTNPELVQALDMLQTVSAGVAVKVQQTLADLL